MLALCSARRFETPKAPLAVAAGVSGTPACLDLFAESVVELVAMLDTEAIPQGAKVRKVPKSAKKVLV